MNVLRSLKKNAHQLENISKERIRDELDKMLVTNSPHKAIKLLKVSGLLKQVMPEMIPAIKMVQNVHHKHDVFDHTLEVMKKTNPVLIQRLMALFHDIGKTVTKTVTPTGIHFYGHEDESEKLAEQIMKRLKYPNDLIDAVKLGVKNHMRLKSGGDDAVKLTDKTLRRFKFEMGNELENILDVMHADNVAHAEASSMPNQIKNVRSRLEKLDQVAQKPKLPINGHDLIEHFNLKPSAMFSKIMSSVLEAWYENPNITKEQALDIAKNIVGN
jgi:tRNA nucleotidyltransferase/poly(A) polymerase